MSTFLAALLNSLDQGMLLFVIAIGLNLIFGVLGILNFAHGALYMLGAYFALTAITSLAIPFWISLVVVPPAVALLAIVLERVVLQHVYGRHITFSLLLTFAVLLVLDDGVRILWGAGIHIIDPPALLAGTLKFAGVSYPAYGLFVIAAGVALVFLLWYLFARTRIGKTVRAASLDREMAEALGIDVPRVYTLVFAFGVWLAALGGTMAAPMRAIGPSMGDKIIIESFIAVVIGGLGSFPGTLAGALILGFIHGFGARWLPDWDIVLPFIGMALVLLLRPEGLAGRSA